jgi:hypothetical protein
VSIFAYYNLENNRHNRFDNVIELTEIFQFRRALKTIISEIFLRSGRALLQYTVVVD